MNCMRKWFQNFDTCSDTDRAKEAKKLPSIYLLTLLEGKALVGWMKLTEDEKKTLTQ